MVARDPHLQSILRLHQVGRRTFEVTRGHGPAAMPGVRRFVFSRTLRQSDYDVVQALREEEGKDIWLFGGGSLFRSLAEAGFVDTVEVAIIPIVLGGGIPLVAEPAARVALTLQEHTVYAKTGTVFLVYAVNDAVQVTGRVIESRTSKHRAVRSGSPLLPVPTGHLLVEAAIDGVATRVT